MRPTSAARRAAVVPDTATRSRGAFTLVELLVVIGIIGLLVAILLPSLQRARSQANVLKCLSNVRQINIACQMYANENGGYLPRYTEVPPTGLPTVWRWNWTGLIFNYIGKNTKVFECPGRAWKTENGDAMTGTFRPDGVNGPSYGPVKVAYQVNGVIPGAVTSLYGARMSMPFGPRFKFNGTAWADDQGTLRLSQVAPDTIMVVESVRGSIEQTSKQFSNDGTAWAGVRNLAVSSHDFRVANIAFADGHAETVDRAYVFKDPKFDITGVLTPASPSWQTWGTLGDLSLPNNTNRPRGYWTAAKGD
jgi:prepilin-type processing-associated H-X9-DG protein/prepilin-type N-terminal cleavage/methylation domain-containing protein